MGRWALGQAGGGSAETSAVRRAPPSLAHRHRWSLAPFQLFPSTRCSMVFVIFSLVLAGGWAAVLQALRWATRCERR